MLRLGATPLTSAADVLETFGLAAPAPEDFPLREHLPASADELARVTGLSAPELAALLAELELSGAVVEAEGVYRSAR